MELTDNIQAYVNAGKITLDAALALTPKQKQRFDSEIVRALIDNGTLTLEKALTLTFEQWLAIHNQHALQFMNAGQLTFEQVLGLTFDQISLLSSEVCRALIDNNNWTVDQVLKLNREEKMLLENESVRALIDNNNLTVDQVLALESVQREAISTPAIHQFLDAGQLTPEQVLELTISQVLNFRRESVTTLIDNQTLTVEQALALTLQQVDRFELPEIRDLVTNNIITIAQLMQLTEDEFRALHDEDTRQRLEAGDLTIDNIIGNHAHNAAPVVHIINDSQSTHNASVHQSVSKSATQLAKRYKLCIDGAGLESVISKIKSYVKELSDDSQKNQAAKRCVLRITDPVYTFTDHDSGVTTRQLLALTFVAINDNDNRVGSIEDARAQFVKGLYEIQRGYNLSQAGEDDGGQDLSICAAGTFNKLIEKLHGIHPDCQVRFITKTMASLKLPIVVREEAIRYLAPLANPSTAERFREFTQLMSQVKEDGVAVILDKIKGNVADRMFDEFGSLYQNRADHLFTSLVDAGQYTELPDLCIFLEQVQNSPGYHQYCSQMLRRSGMFSSPEKSAYYLIEHRHSSSEAQQKFDERFGLALCK